MTTRPGPFARMLRGASYLGRGFAFWGKNPGIMLLGAVPAFIVAVLYTAAIVVLALNLGRVASWLTPFADGWDPGWATALRAVVAAALLAAGVLIAVLTFSAVTLTVGDPFYERIARKVEQSLGGDTAEDTSRWWRSVGRSLLDGLRLIAVTAVFGMVFFLLGFVPIAGAIAVPVLAAFVGGWFLTVELTGYAFDARGYRLPDRRRMLRRRRAESLGFGVVTYLLFLVPLGTIVATPAAVAGATMLSRLALDGEERSPRTGSVEPREQEG